MITLSRVGDTIKFTFSGNPLYLNDGVIEAPLNSLTLVTDNSGIATFKKSATNDIFVCACYDELGISKSELETWFKNNAVGGGGTPSGDVQTMIDQSISGMADNASYDSVSQKIKFYNGNTEVYSVDASDFVIDGMIDDVRIETISGVTYLVIDFNTASGKEDIQIPLTDIFDPSDYYTKTEVDQAISGKADTTAVTQSITEAVSGKQDTLSAGVGIDISQNVISVENPTVVVTQAEYDALVQSGTVDPSTYYIISDATQVDINQYWTSAQTQSAINQATSGKVDTSTVTAVNNVLTAHTADTTIHVTSADKTAWNAKSDFSGSYNDLTDKPIIPTVPTSNTAFTNDAGYITSDALSGYAESTAVTQEISEAVSGKADTSAVTAVQDSLSGYVATSAVTTAVTSGSTDAEIPTAKAVYDAIPTGGTGGGKAIEGGRGITVTTGETADTVSFNLPISAGTGVDSVLIGYSSSDNYWMPKATAKGAIAAGAAVSAMSECSFAFGYFSKTTGSNSRKYSFAHGYNSIANGSNSHAEGNNTITNGSNSHAEGSDTIANNYAEHANGKYNVSSSASTTFGDSGNTLFSVGNGTAENARHNAFEIRQNGDIYITSGGTDILLQDNLGGGGGITSGEVQTMIDESVSGKVDTSSVVTAITSSSTDAQVPSAKCVYDQLGGLKLLKITQAAYDALSGNTDSNTLYVITNS